MTDAIKVWGAPEGWDAFLLAQRRREHSGSVLHVARDDARMARLTEALAFVMPEAEILRFPAWDCLPYDRVSPNPALVSERIATLARLLEKPAGPRIVLTTVNALVQRVPPRTTFAGASLGLAVNAEVKPETLAAYLEANGYGRAGTVMEPGEYAMRGGIIDIFPSGETGSRPAGPVRRHHRIDPRIRPQHSAQRRQAQQPVACGRSPRCRWARTRSPGSAPVGATCSARTQPTTHCICRSRHGRRHPGMEHWVPLFHPTMENLLDYLPDAAVSLDHPVPTKYWRLGWR